jgi:ATP-dependent DNA ligase
MIEYQNNEYMYTDKLDGEHNFLLIQTGKSDTIVECEMYNDKFYLFDILKHNGKDVTDLNLP